MFPLVQFRAMGWCYQRLLRPLLFLQDSEAAHNRVLRGLAWASRGRVLTGFAERYCGAPALPVNCLGLRFPNPVGLAAGMDKAAAAVPMWPRLGFGFAELGGVTRHGQRGNDPPRMFRAVPERALVNRMGFNNPGAEMMAATLAKWRALGLWPDHPVGINLGKSKVTPLAEAAEDYAFSVGVLRDHADFFVINVSSPNTPNLRKLQDKTALSEIIDAVRMEATSQPLLVKVAPDLSNRALDEVLELATDRGLSGIVATNTTITRPRTVSAKSRRVYGEVGGLSGAPLRARSTEVIRHIYKETQGRLPIIGVGGILNADDAWEKITAGASLVQVYTGLVYEGPTVVREIVTELTKRMDREGVKKLPDLIGTATGRQI